MKPRTEYQKRVVAVNGSLRNLANKHFVEVYNRACTHIAFQNKGNTLICGDCGEVIEQPKISIAGLVRCPHCSKKLKPLDSKKWSTREVYYIMAIDQSKGLQILRYYLLYTYFRKHQPVRLLPLEIFRVYINECGQRAVCSKLRTMFSAYRDQWNMNSDIELRQPNMAWRYTPYDLRAWAHIRTRKFTKECKRAGLDVNDTLFPDAETICKILQDNRYETIWKAGMHEMAFRLEPKEMTALWPALKICMRNGYNPNNVKDYIDYVKQLIQLEKDIHNAHYVCPVDLDAEHRRTNASVQKILDRKRFLEEQKRMKEAESAYAKRILPFLNFYMKNKNFHISVLPTVKAFYEEGQAMHHCVYSNRYYERKDTLVLSCRDNDDKRVATIELGLPKCDIRQVRAACNKIPEQYDSIVRLITRQKKELRKLSAAMV